LENLKERNNFKELGIDDWMILKWILQKIDFEYVDWGSG
jgi:hypothetical protein